MSNKVFMLIYFFCSLALASVTTVLVRKIANRFKVVDVPNQDRKTHSGPVALLGGVGIFFSFWGIIFFILRWHQINGIELLFPKLEAAFLGSFILLLIGIADDIRPFSARARLTIVSVAVLITVLSGGGLERITNPFGGFINLGLFVGYFFVFAWLMGMTYTTKILDGLDGLASGVVLIGSLLIYAVTATRQFYQPNVGLVAIIFAGVCAGFLIFNFSPASIFLGESGSLFIGFMLGVLAVIGGGKLATALLVMAVPIFDLARVMYVRLRRGKPLFEGDREHLHFQLRDLGWSERQVVFSYYAIATLFGLTTLFLQSYQKIVALIVLLVVMVGFGWYVGSRKYSNKKQ